MKTMLVSMEQDRNKWRDTAIALDGINTTRDEIMRELMQEKNKLQEKLDFLVSPFGPANDVQFCYVPMVAEYPFPKTWIDAVQAVNNSNLPVNAIVAVAWKDGQFDSPRGNDATPTNLLQRMQSENSTAGSESNSSAPNPKR